MDDGELSVRQLLALLVAYPIVYWALPPTPMPLSSPATTSMVVLARTSTVQLKPVPVSELVERVALGMLKDCPPGMTPTKLTVLESFVIKRETQVQKEVTGSAGAEEEGGGGDSYPFVRAEFQ